MPHKMISGFGIEYLVNDLYVSYRLQQHFSFVFCIRRFTPWRDWTFDVHFSLSFIFDQTGSAAGAWADTRNLKPDLVAAEALHWG